MTNIRGRGTEGIKSPEMLTMNNTNATGENALQMTLQDCLRSDIWSLGCLFFELCTGEFLFDSENWSQHFTHLTTGTDSILSDQHYSKLSKVSGFNTMDVDAAFDILKFILRRDRSIRPTLDQVLQKLTTMCIALKSKDSSLDANRVFPTLPIKPINSNYSPIGFRSNIDFENTVAIKGTSIVANAVLKRLHLGWYQHGSSLITTNVSMSRVITKLSKIHAFTHALVLNNNDDESNVSDATNTVHILMKSITDPSPESISSSNIEISRFIYRSLQSQHSKVVYLLLFIFSLLLCFP